MSATPTTSANVEQNGWTAVPVDPSKIFHGKEYVHKPEALNAADIPWPKSGVVDKVHQICKDKLPEKVYNHSMRVYYYGESRRKCREATLGAGGCVQRGQSRSG